MQGTTGARKHLCGGAGDDNGLIGPLRGHRSADESSHLGETRRSQLAGHAIGCSVVPIQFNVVPEAAITASNGSDARTCLKGHENVPFGT